jgi:hypothetical protein
MNSGKRSTVNGRGCQDIIRIYLITKTLPLGKGKEIVIYISMVQ